MKAAAALLAAAVSAAAGCDNMSHQPHRRGEAIAVRPPPAHTVSHDAATVPKTRPAVSRALLLRGRDRYHAACAVCHGEDGYGRGMIVRRGFPAPPSFHDARLRSAPDSEFLRAIGQGSGVMFAAADRVPREDRWAVVAYIRALQLSQHAALADVPGPERAALERP